jgi:hypothetical protein
LHALGHAAFGVNNFCLPAPLSTALELGSRARLSAHTLRDYALRPGCTDPSAVPWCAEALSPEWLTPALCHGVPGAKVIGVEVTSASAGSSVRKRVRVSYNAAGIEAGLPQDLFAKTTPDVLTRLTSGTSAGQEARFFMSLAPELRLEVPAHCVSRFDRVTGRSLHLFEDVVVRRGARFCDAGTAFSQTEMAAALVSLARLHGATYGDPRLDSSLGWIPRYETFFAALAATGTREGHDRAMMEARAVIPPAVHAARERLWPAAEASLADHGVGPRSVIHSDVHPGNWYLTPDGRPGLCDWQCIAQGHWARDLAYALSSMLEPEARRAWQPQLIAGYLHALKASGGPAVTHEDATALYRRQLPVALLMWTPTLCHPPTMPDMQPPEVSLAMIRRITTAIDDAGGLP